VAGLRETTATTRFKEYEEKLRPLCGQQTIVRVDRAEPSKNIIRGFRAFDMLLERYPQFRGRLKFIAFLVPSRVHLKPYQRYNQDTFQLVEEINARHGTADWKPIEVFFENNYIQALAGMRLYDVLLVNAVIDGMNLIAKEGPTVNERDGVLVLSETVGAHEQLGEYALTVAPADLEGTVQSLYTALTMPAAEKKRRARALKSSIEKEDLSNWLYCLLDDASRLT
jgi:trehalose 6-phosphate synthase